MSAYRAGPWPGLTPRGAAVLLGGSALLAAGQLLVGTPRQAWPDLILLAVTACAPVILATRVVHTPGAASAVCGAYLLPRTLLSLANPDFEPPPLLLVPAVAYDLSLWLRVSDVWPLRRNRWRRRDRTPRRVNVGRAVTAGALFGLVLSAIEPPFALLLGGDPAAWSGPDLWTAALSSAVGCALLGLSARGTGS